MLEEPKLKDIFKKAAEDAKNVSDILVLDKLRFKYLGRKKGLITSVLRNLKNLNIKEKRKIGPFAQKIQKELGKLFDEKEKELKEGAEKFAVDITLPAQKTQTGHFHPLTKVEKEVKEIFSSMSFSVVEGPEIETEYNNFDALNIPPSHPARDMWDTFWLKSANGKQQITNNENRKLSADSCKLLLRTHTSPVQIRYMKAHKPPFQIIAPGRAFRYEATDASHETNFYQVEGLMVGEKVSLANFKFIIEEFLKKFFDDQKMEFRFVPTYFPFVEPGVQVDMRMGKKTGWLEIMGAGMVHPNVFKAVGYNSLKWQGFAFGMGLDRLAMLKYKIPDIRLFYGGDLRFINQF